MGRVESRARTEADVASKFRPGPASLPRDQMMIEGYHGHCAVHMCRFPIRVVPERLLAVPHAVRLHIGLVDHVDPVPVAELVPKRIVGVMGGAHRVDVEALHEPDVRDHAFPGHSAAPFRIVFVAVHPFQTDRFPVEQKAAVPDLHLAKTETAALRFYNPARFIRKHQDHGVQVRALSVPQARIRHFNGQVNGLLFSGGDP